MVSVFVLFLLGMMVSYLLGCTVPLFFLAWLSAFKTFLQ